MVGIVVDLNLALSCFLGVYRLSLDLIEECLTQNCDYLNVGVDSVWVEQITAGYQEKAKQKGTLVVNSCGVHPVLGDLAVLNLLENDDIPLSPHLRSCLKGDLRNQYLFVKCRYTMYGGSGCLSTGLWGSMLDGYRRRILSNFHADDAPVPCRSGKHFLRERTGTTMRGTSESEEDFYVPYYSGEKRAWCIPISKKLSFPPSCK